ncbi:MAG TPA: hypothetical protein VGT98_10615, partial [Candidatus Elarobacter sp.]|nr:hypothetical protein [Candidatus Elarobacter sp.]
ATPALSTCILELNLQHGQLSMSSHISGLGVVPLLLAAIYTNSPGRTHHSEAKLPPDEHCTRFSIGDGHALVARAIDAMGLEHVPAPILHYAFSDAISQNYQSDRTYPPYLKFNYAGHIWLDTRSGTQHVDEKMMGAGNEGPQFTLLYDERASFALRDTMTRPFPQGHAVSLRSRPLDATSTMLDWQRAADVRVVARCEYRDYPRVVVERTTRAGDERLYLDPRTGLPVKIDRYEQEALHGDRHVEYVYSNWQQTGVVLLPTATFRMVDGQPEIERTIGQLAFTQRDSAPRMILPDTTPMPVKAPAWPAPDTVRVSDQAFLLVNRAYTNLVTLQRDTVFVLDAQLGEERARQDSAWIAKLFPGRHPVALIVTDLAWPHISGVRFWVARGATVFSHAASREFLTAVVDRRWTTPDALERTQPRTSLKFVSVSDSLALGGGAVRLYAIDGIGSEGAIMAYLPTDEFLYAGDYVQPAASQALYASDVQRAARRVGIAPRRVAAMHLPLSPWAVVSAWAAGRAPAPASSGTR